MHDILPQASTAKVRPLSDFHIKRMLLSPEHWKAYKGLSKLNWKVIKFTDTNKSTVPKTRGVYTFVVKPGIAEHPEVSYLLYVGETASQTFRKRYAQYCKERVQGDKSSRPHVTDMLDRWYGYLWFHYAEIDDPQKITQIEDELLAAYLPPTNKDFPASVSKDVRKVLGT